MEWMKFVVQPFEVAVRVRLKLESLTLIPRPQSAVFFSGLYPTDMVRVSVPTFNTFFMVRVRVRVRVILVYDVIIDTYTGTYTKLQTLVRQISPTHLLRQKKVARLL